MEHSLRDCKTATDPSLRYIGTCACFPYIRHGLLRSCAILRTIARTDDGLYTRSMGMDPAPGITFYERCLKSFRISKKTTKGLNVQSLFHHTSSCMVDMTSSSQTSIPSETSETTPQLPLMQGNIFVSNGAQKLPFGFVRSMDGPEENLTLSTNLDASRWRSQLESFLGAQNRHISWPFYPCIEQQAAASLPHLRCTVCAIQGIGHLLFSFPEYHRDIPTCGQICARGFPRSGSMGHWGASELSLYNPDDAREVHFVTAPSDSYSSPLPTT